ncbi:MAG: polymer-forming cytoskeletal protein [Allosphingosinicella sp.]
MFSRDAKNARPAAAKGAKFSFLGPEVVVTGDVETSGQLHIDGTVRGDVSCGSLSQGESGAVHGNIVAEEARLAGLVDGAVDAGILTLDASARVTGDVLYDEISIAKGALIDGRFRRRKGAADAMPAGAGKALRSVPAEAKAPPPAGLLAALEEPPTAEAAE